jgi:hypothetical protein
LPQSIVNILVIVALVALIVVLVYARRQMRRAVYNKMNQPGKQKSAIQKWLGW